MSPRPTSPASPPTTPTPSPPASPRTPCSSPTPAPSTGVKRSAASTATACSRATTCDHRRDRSSSTGTAWPSRSTCSGAGGTSPSATSSPSTATRSAASSSSSARSSPDGRRSLTANVCSCRLVTTSHHFPRSVRRAGGSVFRKVRSAVDALKATARALDPARIDGHAAAALLDAVSEGERVCGAMKALLARRIEETKVWRESGHRSAAHWVAETTGETVGAAHRTLETARALGALPETDAAFRAGRLSPIQAAEITSAAGTDPTAESGLLDAAGSTSVKGLRDRCRQVRAGAEVDDRAWARRLHVERRAHEWNDPEGFYRLEARLAPDAGARLSSAWQAHIDRIFRDARRAGTRESRAAYAADALVALASEGPCKPVEVRVTVDSAALARGPTEPGERCEIAGVGPVPVTTARALLDDAAVAVITRDGD